MCARYIACVAVTVPNGLPAAQDGFGSDSACWSEGPEEAMLCAIACQTGLEQSNEAFPAELKCDPCVDMPGCSSSGIGLAADIQPIFNAHCVDCHTPRGAAELSGLVLDAGDAYSTLVGVPSNQAPGMNLVEPGDRTSSYLWHKLENTQADVGGSGTRMPLGAMLSDDDIELIGAWIDKGAAP